MPNETLPLSPVPVSQIFPLSRSFTFTDIGAAYGTAKSGVGISSMGVMNPGLVMRNIIPVVMAGVLGIYGLIVAVILSGSSESVVRTCFIGFGVPLVQDVFTRAQTPEKLMRFTVETWIEKPEIILHTASVPPSFSG